jgi:hypothetical protein
MDAQERPPTMTAGRNDVNLRGTNRRGNFHRHREPPVPVWLELHTDHEPRMRVAASEARQFQ